GDSGAALRQRNRPFHCGHDLEDRNLARLLGQGVSALVAPLRNQQPALRELLQQPTDGWQRKLGLLGQVPCCALWLLTPAARQASHQNQPVIRKFAESNHALKPAPPNGTDSVLFHSTSPNPYFQPFRRCIRLPLR